MKGGTLLSAMAYFALVTSGKLLRCILKPCFVEGRQVHHKQPIVLKTQATEFTTKTLCSLTLPTMIGQKLALISVCLVLTCLPCKTSASVMSTPEPAADPLFSASQLVVASAGRDRMRARIPERVLSNGSRICPGDYARGFSIRCDAASAVRKARFYVDGKHARTEYHAPYYLAGNFKVFVKPWKKHGQGMVEIRCRLGRKEELVARVWIGC